MKWKNNDGSNFNCKAFYNRIVKDLQDDPDWAEEILRTWHTYVPTCLRITVLIFAQ